VTAEMEIRCPDVNVYFFIGYYCTPLHNTYKILCNFEGFFLHFASLEDVF